MTHLHHITASPDYVALMRARSVDEVIGLLHGCERNRRLLLLKAALFGEGDDKRPAKPARKPPPDGLRTPTEVARKLRFSIKTLNAHVAGGALRYVNIGHGRKRVRRMFTDADLDEFIANQTRKDVPCPSTPSRARRSSTSNSASEVIAFTAAPKPRPGARPKK